MNEQQNGKKSNFGCRRRSGDSPTGKIIIEKEGYTVIAARDGKEAYKLLQSDEPFVAAVFDVVMPYIQGTELVRYMQSEKRLMKIPVDYDDG
jgi:CheY-like chemotaxis protein